MKKRAFILIAVSTMVAILSIFIIFVKAEDNSNWWNDVYIEGSTQYSNWPATLAVILVEFPDVTHEKYKDKDGVWQTFIKVYTWQNFHDMLASDNIYFSPSRFSPDNEDVYGSLRDYCGNMSNETYRPTIEILNDKTSNDPNLPPVWFVLPHTKSYYDSLTSGTFLILTNDAIAAAQSAGKNVTTNANRRLNIVYAGNRRKNIGGTAFLGGSRYMLYERLKWTAQDSYKVEYQDAPFTHMGMHIHEFGHVRGFHHTKANRWCPMDDGQKNGPGPSFGACPAPFSPWFRKADNWVTQTLISGDLTNANLAYNGSPNHYKIEWIYVDNKLESLWIENRQFISGYDRYLPGANGGTGGPGGLLIWDILGSDVSADTAVNLIEADNTPINNFASMPNDIFRPTGAFPYQKIYDYSSPATLKLRDGTLSRFSVENYTANGNTITVNFKTKLLHSGSSNATAYNNSRKLVRDSSGAYHLVYESDGNIYHIKSTDGGSTWTGFKRLNRYLEGQCYAPSIAERSGRLYLVWYRFDGNTFSVYFRKSLDGGNNWIPVVVATQLVSGQDQNAPLPVVISPATDKLMVIYRSATALGYKLSDNDGSTWTTGTVPSTAASDISPTLAPTTTYWGGGTRSALVYARTPGTIYYRYYRHGPDSSEAWSSAAKNLSQIVPGSYTGHKNPSLAPSGSSGDKRLHIAWEANNGANKVIIHRKATDWYAWPSVYSLTYYQEQQLPSITGLSNDTAELLFQSVSQNQIYKMHYTGSSWGSPVSIAAGRKPPVSAGGVTAKYVWMSGSASPYEIKTSSETLTKTGENPLAISYHRSIAVIDTATALDSARYAWLEVRLDKIAIKTNKGEETIIPFAQAQEDPATLTSQNAFENLASATVSLPATAESLLVHYTVSGEGLSAVKDISTVAIGIFLNRKNGAPLRLPLANLREEKVPEMKRVLALPVTAFTGDEISLNLQVAGVANKSTLIASLGHIYEIVEEKIGKTSDPVAAAGIPQNLALAIFPTPFNPATRIRFEMPEEGLASLRIYNLQGQLVRQLLDEYYSVGAHDLAWDGRDDLGQIAASGVYFIRLQAGKQMRTGKAMLLR